MVPLRVWLLLVGLAGCGVSEAEQADACAKGVPQKEVDLTPGRCNFLTDGRCFADQDTACSCAGCSADQCNINESYPAVPGCN